MLTQQLLFLIGDNILNRINTSLGLTMFAHRRAKFEGWLKVEIIDILVNNNINALPEIGFVDVTFGDVAIELKTLNTNIAFENVISSSKPITNNVDGVIKDIICLRNTNYEHKYVLFLVFPITHHNAFWQKHFRKLEEELAEIVYRDFHFNNNIPGVMYLGRV